MNFFINIKLRLKELDGLENVIQNTSFTTLPWTALPWLLNDIYFLKKLYFLDSCFSVFVLVLNAL